MIAPRLLTPATSGLPARPIRNPRETLELSLSRYFFFGSPYGTNSDREDSRNNGQTTAPTVVPARVFRDCCWNVLRGAIFSICHAPAAPG